MTLGGRPVHDALVEIDTAHPLSASAVIRIPDNGVGGNFFIFFIDEILYKESLTNKKNEIGCGLKNFYFIFSYTFPADKAYLCNLPSFRWNVFSKFLDYLRLKQNKNVFTDS